MMRKEEKTQVIEQNRLHDTDTGSAEDVYKRQARTSGRFSFANRVGWEVVLMHIAFGIFVVDTIQNLSIRNRTEGCDGHNLSLSTGEQCRTMSTRNET